MPMRIIIRVFTGCLRFSSKRADLPGILWEGGGLFFVLSRFLKWGLIWKTPCNL